MHITCITPYIRKTSWIADIRIEQHWRRKRHEMTHDMRGMPGRVASHMSARVELESQTHVSIRAASGKQQSLSLSFSGVKVQALCIQILRAPPMTLLSPSTALSIPFYPPPPPPPPTPMNANTRKMSERLLPQPAEAKRQREQGEQGE